MCCLPVIQCVHNLCFDPLFIIQAALDESYEILCADVAMLNSRESSQPPNSKEFWRRILHQHANRIPGCQLYPVERSLHIRQAFVQLSGLLSNNPRKLVAIEGQPTCRQSSVPSTIDLVANIKAL